MTTTYEGYTFTSPFGEIIWESLQPWATLSLAIYSNAMGTCFDEVYALVAETGSDGDPSGYTPTWGTLFDVTLCPTDDLPYLGQYVGVSIPLTASDADARAAIVAEAFEGRGTRASMAFRIVRNISTVWAPATSYLAGVMFSYQATPGATTYYLVGTNYTSGATFGATDLANATAVDPATQYSFSERTPDPYTVSIVVKPEQLTPTNNLTALLADVTIVKPAGILLGVIATDSPQWSAATSAWNAVAGTVTWANVKSGDV